MKLERERQPRITCTMPNRDDVDDNTASLMGILAVITCVSLISAPNTLFLLDSSPGGAGAVQYIVLD